MIDRALYVTKLKALSYDDFLQYKEDEEKLFNPVTQQKPFFRFMDYRIQIHTDS